MKISAAQSKSSPSFNGMMNNKILLKGLEKVSEHGTSFIAATSFAMSSGIRPLAIAVTPDVKKENKQYAITNSIASGLVKFAFVEAIALPIENAIKKAEKSPKQYLKQLKPSKNTTNRSMNLNSPSLFMTKLSNNTESESDLVNIDYLNSNLLSLSNVPIESATLYTKLTSKKMSTAREARYIHTLQLSIYQTIEDSVEKNVFLPLSYYKLFKQTYDPDLVYVNIYTDYHIRERQNVLVNLSFYLNIIIFLLLIALIYFFTFLI